ncbi:MAG: hypothetical protein AB4050_17710 [Synechococcus sp.]
MTREYSFIYSNSATSFSLAKRPPSCDRFQVSPPQSEDAHKVTMSGVDSQVIRTSKSSYQRTIISPVSLLSRAIPAGGSH